jgi:hypothetical protein
VIRPLKRGRGRIFPPILCLQVATTPRQRTVVWVRSVFRQVRAVGERIESFGTVGSRILILFLDEGIVSANHKLIITHTVESITRTYLTLYRTVALEQPLRAIFFFSKLLLLVPSRDTFCR